MYTSVSQFPCLYTHTRASLRTPDTPLQHGLSVVFVYTGTWNCAVPAWICYNCAVLVMAWHSFGMVGLWLCLQSIKLCHARPNC